MVHLSLTGLSGTRLQLVDAQGVEYTLDVDAKLRAALRGEQTRPSKLETPMDSALRPRDIQARIRAGESAEQVAEAAGTSLERIMPYAAPVLAEREHMAERAQACSVRRRGGEGQARTLGEAVAVQLRMHGGQPEEVEWDAWRREDNRWVLTALFESREREGVATFVYDPRGSYVTLDDADARWLVGEAVPAAPPARDDLAEARERRLASTDPDEGLGADAISLVSDPATPSTSTDSGTGSGTGSARGPELIPDLAVELRTEGAAPASPGAAAPETAAPGAPTRQRSTVDAEETAARVRGARPERRTRPQGPADPEQLSFGETDVPSGDDAEAEKPAKKPAKRGRGRASVPSWDEIMFGGGDKA